MNSKINTVKMKFFLRLSILNVFLFGQISAVFAQSVEQDTIQGEVFFVYPFSNEITMHSNYHMAVKGRRGENKYTYKDYYIEMFGADYKKRDFRLSKRKMLYSQLKSFKFRREQPHLNRKFKKAVRKNPFPLLEQRYSLENDVVPCLDKIPDGKYVQYFEGYYPIDKKGRLHYSEKKASGYFTIKNNLLEGDAVWLNLKGDTLKKGRFENGLKVGEWFLEVRKVAFSISKLDAKLYSENGSPAVDTTKEYASYSEGFQNGPYTYYLNSEYPILQGFYTDNAESGEWQARGIGFTGKGKNRKRNRNNTIITATYSPKLNGPVVKQPIIRKRLLSDMDYLMEYNFDSKYNPSVSFSQMYSINIPKELDIELDEEAINGYEGEEYEEEYYEEEYYDEEMSDFMEAEEDYYYEEDYYGEESAPYLSMIYDPIKDMYISKAKMMDSLGIVFNFQGVYEKRYPNGQLMLRYEFENGKLVEEDTIFWDNGKPYDVITFNLDSSQYVQKVYDYDGKLYNELVFDSIGEFLRINFEPKRVKFIQIGNLLAEDKNQSNFYFYDKMDTMQYELKDSLLLFRSWLKEDTSLLYTRSYNPNTRSLNFESFAITGKQVLSAEVIFSDSFESWTGFKDYHLGNLTTHTTSSASLNPYQEKDTIPKRNVNDFSRLFDITDEFVIQQNKKPYTGEVKVVINETKFELNSGKKIKLVLPRPNVLAEKLIRQKEKYAETGKNKQEILFHTLDASELGENFSTTIFSSLFGGFLDEYVNFPYSEYDDYGMQDKGYKEKKEEPFSKDISGFMLDGQPHGTWIIKDQFGKMLYEIPFEKGVINGIVKEYDTKYPKNNEEYYYSNEEYLMDSIPRKKTHYLFSSSNYKNGMPNGIFNQYNWLGQQTKQTIYQDGFREGKAFERNNLAYTSLNYANGELDGYIRTYLTLKGQDSLLLFDLNFQNGLMQGESRSYHTNGKLAKKGFFLNGDPIDDYEAFDTLGFKYHYVKFLYSFPVEEKIWEENQLSARYLFDWRDSIYFESSDITSTQSLDRMLVQLGINGDFYEKPYYGRPSMVDKTNIDYQITKYYPNDEVARDGNISAGKKVGCWKYFSYDGEFLYEVDYFDSILTITDSVQFKSKGILTDYDAKGRKLSESFIIEKFEKYDCSHTDHYEIRQLRTIFQENDSIDRMNGYVKNYFDNGVIQNEGWMKNGLPSGIWKFYDPYGKLNQVGTYVLGKRDGRWLGGDLSKTKYLGDICLNPNLPNLEEEIKYRENLLDIVITNYKMGQALNKEFYDVNMNDFEQEEMVEEGKDLEEK